MAASVAIRQLAEGDALETLTALLHRAYASLGARGLNYTAVDQSVEETARRIAQGVCAVATLDSVLVGTVLARGGPNLRSTSRWYQQPNVASAGQLAVDPAYQGRGIGSSLVAWAEQWAKSRGYAEIAVDTAEPADHLKRFYTARGYRFVEIVQWQGKRYRSVVLSKSLMEAP
ncbi:MAG TPA: GNAT family N-acetyltransferase [Casimicrobiaceae bacterium]|nr:GNAT family N-acetyltransferase [Casimicrobiaceae bacterium]